MVPAKPTGLQADATTDSLDVSLDWDDVTGASYYLVRWRSIDNGERLNEGVEVKSSNTDITVADYGEWRVRVQACNDAGCGQPLALSFEVEAATNAHTGAYARTYTGADARTYTGAYARTYAGASTPAKPTGLADRHHIRLAERVGGLG